MNGKKFHGKSTGNEIHWNDGDIWKRQTPFSTPDNYKGTKIIVGNCSESGDELANRSDRQDDDCEEDKRIKDNSNKKRSPEKTVNELKKSKKKFLSSKLPGPETYEV